MVIMAIKCRSQHRMVIPCVGNTKMAQTFYHTSKYNLHRGQLRRAFVVCTRTSRLQEYLRRIIGVVGQEIYGSIVPPHKVRNLLMLLRVACLVVDAPLRVRVPGIERVTLSKRRAGRTAVSQPTANTPKKENKLETGQIAAI